MLKSWYVRALDFCDLQRRVRRRKEDWNRRGEDKHPRRGRS
jgi:hypothetical protein